MTDTVLAAAAFGDEPGCWPLPPAGGAAALWLRAVTAGGQGRYASARADLDELGRRTPTEPMRSLALSTRASFLRQLGWHRMAHSWDGRAWAHAGGDAEAGVDALIGLAADALGVGRLAVSASLLARATDLVGRTDGLPARLAVRLAWVGAELAMAGSDGATAVRHASRGIDLAERAAPNLRRHRVKSQVVLAAALSTTGDLGAARSVAAAALTDAQATGLTPLSWALACLLADIGDAERGPAVITAIRNDSATFVTRHGGRWSSR